MAKALEPLVGSQVVTTVVVQQVDPEDLRKVEHRRVARLAGGLDPAKDRLLRLIGASQCLREGDVRLGHGERRAGP
jgi:hypothetical protein